MSNSSPSNQSGIKRRVARRFVIYIVLISSLVTIVTTAVQLFFDYRRDIDAIESHIAQIQSSHLESISNSLWVEDERQIISQLEGLVRYSDIEMLSIDINGVTQWQAGEKKSSRVITRKIPLLRQYRGIYITIGELQIVASIDNVLDRLVDKAIVILVTNALKTFIVAGFIYLLFHYLVARHLFRLGEWARSFKLEANPEPVRLDRREPVDKKYADEFDAVVDAMNQMLQDIHQSYGALKDSHSSMEQQALKSQKILNLHLEKSPLAAITWDREYKCIEWNKSAERIFGYSRDEAIGRRATELIVPASLAAENSQVFEALFRQEGGTHNINHNVTRNGDIILCEWFNTPIKSDDDVPVAIASLAQDITISQQNKAELMNAKEEAEQANRSKSAFLSSMSHELRTPLNAILGFGQLLEMVLEDSMQKKNASEIVKAGNHLLGLINDILDLSKIEAGKIEGSMENVYLNAVIKECLALIKPLAGEYQVQLIDKISASSDHSLYVDFKRCKQVLLNLLSNAVKYNEPQGSVTIACEAVRHNRLRINVTDTGKGIPENKLPSLFEPFNRLGAEASEIDGTGIGLLITKQLVEIMDGEIGVINRPGSGCTFWVELPLSTAALSRRDDAPVETSEQESHVDATASSDALILVAEDNKTNQEVLRQQLELLGYKAEFADDGEQALRKWQYGHYSLILTDVHMPKMGGFELVKSIKSAPRYEQNKLPIIAITADAMAGHAQQCLDAGMDDYIAKPVDMDSLQRMLSRWLSEVPEEEQV